MKTAIVALVPFLGIGFVAGVVGAGHSKSSRCALSVGMMALGSLACGAARQAPPSEVSQESPQTTSERTPLASETEPAATRAWSPAEPQAADQSRSPGESGLARVPGESELSQLDDAQLAAVVQAVNEGEIRIAQLVESRTTNAEVKTLAHALLVSHQALLSKDTALWARLHLTPNASAISARVDADTQTEVTLLTSVLGDAFDRDYVELQVQDQNSAIELARRIVPDLKRADFKAGLKAARSELEGHLRMAESTQESLTAKGVTERQPAEQSDEGQP